MVSRYICAAKFGYFPIFFHLLFVLYKTYCQQFKSIYPPSPRFTDSSKSSISQSFHLFHLTLTNYCQANTTMASTNNSNSNPTYTPSPSSSRSIRSSSSSSVPREAPRRAQKPVIHQGAASIASGASMSSGSINSHTSRTPSPSLSVSSRNSSTTSGSRNGTSPRRDIVAGLQPGQTHTWRAHESGTSNPLPFPYQFDSLDHVLTRRPVTDNFKGTTHLSPDDKRVIICHNAPGVERTPQLLSSRAKYEDFEPSRKTLERRDRRDR